MHTKNQTILHSKWYPVLGIIKFLVYFIILDYIISDIFGVVAAFFGIILLELVIETVKKKWRAAFRGTVYGNVVLKSDGVSSVPIKDIEISWGPSHHRTKQTFPVITNAKGEFRFENLPLQPYLMLTATLTKDRYIHQDIGDFEGVKWFLGRRWLGLPLSSGVPKRVDLIVPPAVSH